MEVVYRGPDGLRGVPVEGVQDLALHLADGVAVQDLDLHLLLVLLRVGGQSLREATKTRVKVREVISVLRVENSKHKRITLAI